MIETTGKPFLIYTQRTWAIDSGLPMHIESGFIRTPPEKENFVEMVTSDPTGICTVLEGMVNGKSLTLTSTSVTLVM